MTTHALFRYGIFFLTLMGLTCAESNRIQERTGKMENHVLFEISLSIIDGPGLMAILRNRSSVERTLLHDTYLQPSEVVLINTSGQVVVPFDTRSIKKYDATVYRFSYTKLPPGGEMVLYEECFKARGNNDYELWWGPYHFEHLPSGIYKTYVIWKSEVDSWVDQESGAQGQMEGIWIGSVKSNQVELRLP